MSQPSPDAKATSVRFREFRAPTAHDTPRRVEVDATGDNGVIYDTLILGLHARGMGVYSPGVMQESQQKYEGAPTYINHTKDGSNPDYHRKLGVHRNIHMSPEGLRSDFHFNAKHPAASQLIWDAKNAPATLGFSHDAQCQYHMERGKRIVDAIERVYGVDLVSRAGTVNGLFESEEDLLDSDPALRTLAENGLAAMDNARSILFAAEVPLDTKRSRLAEALAVWQTELNPAAATPAGTNLKEELNMAVDYKEVTLETLTANCPELVAKLKGTDEMSRLTEEVKTLKESAAAKETELAALKAKDAARLKEGEILAELTEAKFPLTDEKLYSATFKEQLTAAADKTARAAIIKDRMDLTAARMQEHTGMPAPLANLRPEKDADNFNAKTTARFFGE